MSGQVHAGDIAFEFVAPDTVKVVSDVITRVGKDQLNRSPRIANASIAKMSKDYVMQFPMIASAAIPDGDFHVITKSFEVQYAQFVAMVLSGMTGINVNDVKTSADILKLIHSNDDSVPLKLIDYAMTAGDGATEGMTYQFSQSDLQSMEYGTDQEINLESLNAMYQPNAATLARYERSMEASDGVPGRVKEWLKSHPGATEEDYYKYIDAKARSSVSVKKDNDYDADHKRKVRLDNQNIQVNNNRIAQGRIDLAKSHQNTVNVSDLNKIQDTGEAPTVLTATVYVGTDEAGYEPRTLIFATKIMPRRIPSDVMVANVARCITTNTFAFNFIRWTKGELKFVRDLLFDISNSRDSALRSIDPKGVGQWFEAVYRRKKNSKLNASKTSLAPTMTLLITDAEADQIQAACGIDLTQDAAAAKLIKDMYLLGFGIYNTANGTVSMMLDGLSNGRFYHTTTAGLNAQNKAADKIDLKQLNQISRMTRGL